MRLTRRLLLLCTPLMMSGCAFLPAPNTSKPAPPSPQPTVWESLSEGFDQKKYVTEYDAHRYETIVFRLNNMLYQWDLHYSKTPRRLQAWSDELSASLLVNGAFFTEAYEPTGYFAVEGSVVSNSPYTQGNIGTVAISQGKLKLIESAQIIAEGAEAFQSFPLLLSKGLPTIEADSEKIARRTILAQNNQGQTFVILFDATPVTLHDAAQVLLGLGLELDWALNLDGGPSSGVIARGDTESATILPAAELPIVLSAKKVSAASPNGR